MRSNYGVINITDVRPPDIRRRRRRGQDGARRQRRGQDDLDIAAYYTAAFKADLKALNIRERTLWSTATDHVQDMIAFTRKIEAKDTYRLDSGLYFDTSTVPDYGRLAGAATDETVGRIAEVEGKRHLGRFRRLGAPRPRRAPPDGMGSRHGGRARPAGISNTR